MRRNSDFDSSSWAKISVGMGRTNSKVGCPSTVTISYESEKVDPSLISDVFYERYFKYIQEVLFFLKFLLNSNKFEIKFQKIPFYFQKFHSISIKFQKFHTNTINFQKFHLIPKIPLNSKNSIKFQKFHFNSKNSISLSHKFH